MDKHSVYLADQTDCFYRQFSHLASCGSEVRHQIAPLQATKRSKLSQQPLPASITTKRIPIGSLIQRPWIRLELFKLDFTLKVSAIQLHYKIILVSPSIRFNIISSGWLVGSVLSPPVGPCFKHEVMCKSDPFAFKLVRNVYSNVNNGLNQNKLNVLVTPGASVFISPS